VKKHTSIPKVAGLYWYMVPGESAEAVDVDPEKYGEGRFRGFNGREMIAAYEEADN
jgi:hypothetical protein